MLRIALTTSLLVATLAVAACGHARPMTAVVSNTCDVAPAGRALAFAHRRSRVLARTTAPRHRGVDLIAVESDETQTLGGKLAYGPTDKDLEDEAVDVYACMDDGWRPVGTTHTDGDGRFALVLAGENRLPVGMRDLYAHVPGDGSGARFLAYVGAPGASVIVTDIDGTITASENAVWGELLRGRDIAHQPSAPETLAASGKVVVYVTARGDQLTERTRTWLAAHGFPRGPLRLAPALAVLPGSRTIAFKTRTLQALRVPVAAGIGNRHTDVAAYTQAGLASDRIFINLPEFVEEVREALAAKSAVAFDDYRELASHLDGSHAYPTRP